MDLVPISLSPCHFADTFAALQYGNTALLHASCYGYSATVQALLADPRVDVNIRKAVSSICVVKLCCV